MLGLLQKISIILLFHTIFVMSLRWSNPEWNWGYANGLAHDYAAKLRRKLDTIEKREDFCKSVLENKEDVEDIKLCLALRFQRASREGKDGCGKGWEIMQNMADCQYETEEGIENLRYELETLAAKLPNELTSIAKELTDVKAVDDSSVEAAAIIALCGTDFINIGL